MRIAVGIDIGFSERRNSAGVVIIDRDTGGVAAGSTPKVTGLDGAIEHVQRELERLRSSSVTFVLDGPFAAGENGKSRRVETFFQSGPFSSAPRGSPKMRLMPAPTGKDSKFLSATVQVLKVLAAKGYAPIRLGAEQATAVADDGKTDEAGYDGASGVPKPSVQQAVVHRAIGETFPNLFLGCLLAPHSYEGKRTAHSDDLWSRCLKARVSLLGRYRQLVEAVEGRPEGELHDSRAAAVCAIAADSLPTGFPNGANGPGAARPDSR